MPVVTNVPVRRIVAVFRRQAAAAVRDVCAAHAGDILRHAVAPLLAGPMQFDPANSFLEAIVSGDGGAFAASLAAALAADPPYGAAEMAALAAANPRLAAALSPPPPSAEDADGGLAFYARHEAGYNALADEVFGHGGLPNDSELEEWRPS